MPGAAFKQGSALATPWRKGPQPGGEEQALRSTNAPRRMLRLRLLCLLTTTGEAPPASRAMSKERAGEAFIIFWANRPEGLPGRSANATHEGGAHRRR
jgi:hypothetical protein